MHYDRPHPVVFDIETRINVHETGNISTVQMKLN